MMVRSHGEAVFLAHVQGRACAPCRTHGGTWTGERRGKTWRRVWRVEMIRCWRRQRAIPVDRSLRHPRPTACLATEEGPAGLPHPLHQPSRAPLHVALTCGVCGRWWPVVRGAVSPAPRLAATGCNGSGATSVVRRCFRARASITKTSFHCATTPALPCSAAAASQLSPGLGGAPAVVFAWPCSQARGALPCIAGGAGRVPAAPLAWPRRLGGGGRQTACGRVDCQLSLRRLPGEKKSPRLSRLGLEGL